MNAKLQIVPRPQVRPVDLDALARMRPDELQKLHRKMFGFDVRQETPSRPGDASPGVFKRTKKAPYRNRRDGTRLRSQETAVRGFVRALRNGGRTTSNMRRSPGLCRATTHAYPCQAA